MLTSKGTLSPLQKELLIFLSSLKDAEFFYLAGGTALSDFYIGHRKSVDIDFFTNDKDLVSIFSASVEDELKKEYSVKVTRRYGLFVEMEVGKQDETTKVQFAYDSPYRLASPLKSDLGVLVNDYEDLIADKLCAFFGRVEARDAVDVFFILKTRDFWELAELASKKDPGFTLYWLAVALERTKKLPDDIKKWPVEMLMDVSVRELKELFVSFAQQIMEKVSKKT